jgi:hypothetical protein
MNHIFGIMFRPSSEWEAIRTSSESIVLCYLKYVLLIGLLPPVAWYIGATDIGWQLGNRSIRITPESALQIMTLFYLSTLIGIGVLGYMVHWMAETYEVGGSTLGKGIKIAAYTCTPMFLCGITGFYPVLWLDILLGCAAAAYTVYLLYIGVPIVMQIPKERGFLFASALVAVGLVMCAALLGATVMLWEMGAMPVFTD